MPITVQIKTPDRPPLSITVHEKATLRQLIERINAHRRGWESPLPPDIRQYAYQDQPLDKDHLDSTLAELGIADGAELTGNITPPEITDSRRDLSPRIAGVVSDGTFDGLPKEMRQSIGGYIGSNEIQTTVGLQQVFEFSEAMIRKKEQKEFDEEIAILDKCVFPDDWELMKKFDRDEFLRAQGLKPYSHLQQLYHCSTLALLKTDPNAILWEVMLNRHSYDAHSLHFLIYLTLKYGARINDRTPTLGGETPWTYFSQFGDPSNMGLMLEYGADINGTNEKNKTALILACGRKSPTTVVKFLLEKSANVDRVTETGDSALMIACEKGNFELVKLLLEYGADRNLANHQKDTAYTIAKRRGYPGITRLLQTYQRNEIKLTAPSSSGMFKPIPAQQQTTQLPDQKSHALGQSQTIIDQEVLEDLNIVLNSIRCTDVVGDRHSAEGMCITIIPTPDGGNRELRDQFMALFQQHGKKEATAEINTKTGLLIIKGVSLKALRKLTTPPAASSECLIS